jgi:hypothetical protein
MPEGIRSLKEPPYNQIFFKTHHFKKTNSMGELTVNDLSFILESLKYTKLRFEEYPIGEKGYPSYEYKQKRLEDVNNVIAKVKELLARG